MIIFPAIDLKDGQCVRLSRGKMDEATIFNNDPVKQAEKFVNMGFKWLHVVDLNGAFAGRPVNIDSVKSIIKAINIPVQLGGGIRDMSTIEAWLDAGVARVILGTVALKNPALVMEACKKFPSKIVVGIDARHGFVATEGWAESSDINVIDLAKKFADSGVAAIIYTDIERDGVMAGPDIEGTKNLALNVSIPVIASGGISSNEDLRKIKELEKYGVIGVISGRAIYNGAIDIKSALIMAKSNA